MIKRDDVYSTVRWVKTNKGPNEWLTEWSEHAR